MDWDTNEEVNLVRRITDYPRLLDLLRWRPSKAPGVRAAPEVELCVFSQGSTVLRASCNLLEDKFLLGESRRVEGILWNMNLPL